MKSLASSMSVSTVVNFDRAYSKIFDNFILCKGCWVLESAFVELDKYIPNLFRQVIQSVLPVFAKVVTLTTMTGTPVGVHCIENVYIEVGHYVFRIMNIELYLSEFIRTVIDVYIWPYVSSFSNHSCPTAIQRSPNQ